MYFSNYLEISRHSSKEIWKVLNVLMKKQKSVINYPDSFNHDNNSETNDPKVIANGFAEYFTNIGSNLASKIVDTGIKVDSYLKGNFLNSLFFCPSTSQELEKITLSFKNKTSSGSDEVNIKILKSLISFLSTPLCNLINESLPTGIVPNKLKIAKITPLFNSGDPKAYNNYRPISILPCLSKIYEKVVYNRLIDFINKSKILSKCQYGFRSNHSTSLAVVDFLEKMTASIDDGYYSLGVFLDLSKAFDTINHEI